MEILKLFSLFILPYSFVQPYALRNNAGIFQNTLKSAGKTSSKPSETLELDGENRANTIIKPEDVLGRSKRQLAEEDLEAFDGINQEERFEGDGVAEQIVDGVVESFIPALESIGPVFGSLLKPAITMFGGTSVNGAFGIAQDLLSDWNILNPEADSSFEAYPVYIPNKGSFILLTNVGLPETRKQDALDNSKINTRRQSRKIRKFESPAAVGDNGTNFIGAKNTLVTNNMIINVTDFGRNKNKENIDINTSNNTENPDNSIHGLILTSSRDNKTDSKYESNYDTNSIATANVIENDDEILKHFTTQISVSPRIESEDTTNHKQTIEYRSNKNSSNYSNIMKIPEHHAVIENLTTEKSVSSVVNTTEDSLIETEEEITHSTTFEEEEYDFNGNSELTEETETKSVYLGGVHLIPVSDDILFGDINSVRDESARKVKEIMEDIVESQKIVKRGDSGGPLAVDTKNGSRLIGLMSHACKPQGDKIINIFASVPFIESWIFNVTGISNEY